MKKRNLLMTTMATLSASGALFAASSTAMAATTHEIAQNDTLWSLSQKYGVSVKALKKVNKLSSDLIIAGQTLKVPSKAEARLATATTHKVAKGDTLWSIAKKYGVTVASLKKANNLTSDAIDVGQKLRLYASAANTANTVTASANTANASSTSTSAAANSASGASSSTANNSTSPTNAAGNDNNPSQTTDSNATSSQTTAAGTSQAARTNNDSNKPAASATTNSTTSSTSGSSSASAASQAAVSQAPSGSASSASTSASASAIASYAMSFVGVPYVWGGSTPAGFDCSGLVQYVYSHFGISLGRTTYAQENAGTKISVSQAQPGDLYFWGSYGSAYHVAIALGNGQYIQAPAPGQNVSVGSVSYYAPSFAVRVL
ncbi:LysM peptidoglycan-binding domain-containing protein [Lactobacillus porci]|uniref:C40 family peptidase n=1 Tax=Lactobacillus porci TaxID=2012477 RepID=UPI003996761F